MKCALEQWKRLHYLVYTHLTETNLYNIYLIFFSVRLLSVLRGLLFFHPSHNGQNKWTTGTIFHNVFDMTRSLTGDWILDLPYSMPALYHEAIKEAVYTN